MFDNLVKYLNILTKKLLLARLLTRTHKPEGERERGKKSMIIGENFTSSC